MNYQTYSFHISHVCSLWQDLSVGTKLFDLLTFTVTFDQYLGNFNLAYNLCWNTFDFHISHVCCKFWGVLTIYISKNFLTMRLFKLLTGGIILCFVNTVLVNFISLMVVWKNVNYHKDGINETLNAKYKQLYYAL